MLSDDVQDFGGLLEAGSWEVHLILPDGLGKHLCIYSIFVVV